MGMAPLVFQLQADYVTASRRGRSRRTRVARRSLMGRSPISPRLILASCYGRRNRHSQPSLPRHRFLEGTRWAPIGAQILWLFHSTVFIGFLRRRTYVRPEAPVKHMEVQNSLQ